MPPRSDGLETERLILRPFAAGDVAEFLAVWGDPEVIWWGQVARDRDEAESGLTSLLERIAAMPDGMGWWWLVVKETGETVGDVNLQPAPDPPGGMEIGWHLARSHWGNGYATEGAAAMIERAWEIGLDEVIATIVPINVRSVRVAERLGMTRRGPTVPRGNLAHGVWVLERPGRS
ncbi:MAG TPA: GNAT family N-acetyltransferase [Acidimicrobiia bacterium]|nr:GNAT family N-acetyltransferase [Acidimicrobiia bacterium]